LGSEIKQLKVPVKNVNALAAFLKDPKKSGFDADHIFTLTDEEATRRKILMTLNEITKRAAPEDTVVFYFSGHGVRHSERRSEHESTYLVPYDGDLRDIETTCIGFDKLARTLRKTKSNKAVVIVDANYSGGFKPKDAQRAARPDLSKPYIEAFQKPAGRAMLLSSDESEISWEDEESSVFTRFLLEGLNGKADANEDGIITFTEVALYVEETVPKYTRENFPQIQRPTRRYDLGQVHGDIPLAINRADR
jgi:uncharacterized caspase-like protein